MTTKKSKPAGEASTHTNDTGAEAPATATKAPHAGKGNKAVPRASKAPKPRQKATVAEPNARAERKARTDTKQTKLIAMLQAKDGATVEEIVEVLGWQPHTARGAIFGALKKKLGLDITSEKVEGRGRVYRIGS